jgi:tRNA G46 methylase TrmB
MSLSQTISHYLIPLNRLYYLGQKEKTGEVIYNVDSKSKFWIRVNSPDKYTLWETWKLKSYDDDESKIKPFDTIIDIGANIGDFLVWAAQQAPRGKIFAYEPDKNNFSLLTKNKKLNNCNNIWCYR